MKPFTLTAAVATLTLVCGALARADDDATTCFDAQKTSDFAAMAVYCRSAADSHVAFLAETSTAPPEMVAAAEGMAALLRKHPRRGWNIRSCMLHFAVRRSD